MANEFRAQADAIRSELLDSEKQFTPDELQQKVEAIKGLEIRAQVAAEFTPDKEIESQGGTGTLTRVDAPEQREELPETFAIKVDRLRTDITKHFGGMTAYVRAAMAEGRGVTGAQAEIMKRAGQLTRTIVGTASDASGAEYLLPLQQDQSLFRVDNAIPGLLQRARRFAVSGRTYRIPYVKQTDGDITRPLSSISAISIVGEATTKPTKEPVFAQRLLTVYKYAAIAKVGDETIGDDFTGDLQPAITEMVGGEVMNQINYDVTINGSGSSMPTAALHTSGNAALLKVSRKTADTVTADDAFNMYAKHTHGARSFWLVSRSALAKVMQMTLTGTTLVTYLPNLNGNPMGASLLGYPIVVSDFLNTLGDEGDFALVNPDFYALGLRQALTVESSIHYAFVDDVTTYRFVARAGGIPIPDGTYAYRSVSSSKVDEHSPFVVLDDVVAS